MNLVIVEDSLLVREQLMRLIGAHPGIQIVGYAETCDSAADLIIKEQPDVILLDLMLRSGYGIDVLAKIRASGCRSSVLVLTNHVSDGLRLACESYDIAGFYDKTLETSLCMAKLLSWLPPHQLSSNA